MVVYEGAPNYPSTDRLFQVVEKHRVRTLGISPTAVRVLRAAGDEWIKRTRLIEPAVSWPRGNRGIATRICGFSRRQAAGAAQS